MLKICFDSFAERLAVSLPKEFYHILRERLSEKNTRIGAFSKYLASKLPYSHYYINNCLKPSSQEMIPWVIIREISQYTGMKLTELESKIVQYGLPRCRSPVINPQFPMVHTPIMDMLIAHVIADGCIVRSQGRVPYVSFRQYNERFMECFRKQCECVFGKIPSLYTGKDLTKTYLPGAPTQAIFSVSNLSEEDFFSKKAPMPMYIYDLSRKNQFAFLLAFVFDEGHVDSSNIVIRLKNKNLIQGLNRIAKNLEYETTITSYQNGMHQLYLRSASLECFYNEYIQLKETYDCIDLGYKEDLLLDNLTRMRKRRSQAISTKRRILQSLEKKNQKTVNQLAKQLYFTRQGIRYNIQTLMKQGKIQRVRTIPGKPPEYVYGLWE